MRYNCMKAEDAGKFTYKVLLILFIAAIVASIIPLLFISKYNIPAADDFSFSCETHEAIKNGGTLLSVLSGAAEKVQKVYYTWQGTFSAIFLMALQPSIWGFEYYSITAYIMLFSLLFSIFSLCIRIFSGVFKIQKRLSGIIAAIIFFAWIQFLPSPNQGLFWYNSSVYYTFTFAVFLAAIAVTAGYLLYGGKWRLLILSGLFIIIGASNFVTALIAAVLILLCIGILILNKNKKWGSLLIPAVFLFASFALSVTAPGNQTRQALFTDHPGIAASILLSFAEASRAIARWADLRYLFFLLLLFPFIRAAALSACRSSFPLPGCVTAFSFCMLSAMFTPQIYSMGNAGPDRLQNIIYFTFILLSAFNLFYWLGWGRSKRKMQRDAGSEKELSLTSIACFAVSAFICLSLSVVVFHQPLSSVAALGELRSGEAKAYYEEALARQEILEDDSIKNCVFPPHEHMPYLLYFTDMTDDPDYYENQDTCTYYGKTSIIVR